MLGYPAGWTDVTGVPRTKRLSMLGNSVQVQCGTIVGELLATRAVRPERLEY